MSTELPSTQLLLTFVETIRPEYQRLLAAPFDLEKTTRVYEQIETDLKCCIYSLPKIVNLADREKLSQILKDLTSMSEECIELKFRYVVSRTEQMTEDRSVYDMLKRHGLVATKVSWEDTSRYKGSSLGDNITDVTLRVQTSQKEVHLMPVIRFPNFSDKTGDIPPEKLFLLVGNNVSSKKDDLQVVSLVELLTHWQKYLSDPKSVDPQSHASLYDEKRDKHVLVSAQACFLPVPEHANKPSEFHPTAFNYQSRNENPAVLLILCTCEGTSITIAGRDADDNQLFFNEAGKRAALTAERKKEFMAKEEAKIAQMSDANARKAAKEKLANDSASLNLVLLIQVPLKHKKLVRSSPEMQYLSYSCAAACSASSYTKESCSLQDTTDDAVIGHGASTGTFLECDKLVIERDTNFPVRVTVQFYSATATGIVNDDTISKIAAQIGKVYEKSDFVGSLVTEGKTGRTTEAVPNPIQ